MPMTIPPEVFMWVVGGLIAILMAVGGWTWGRVVTAVINLGVSVGKLKDELAEHKLESEKRFAKIPEVNDKFGKLEGTLQQVQKEMQSQSNTLSAMATVMQMKPQPQQILMHPATMITQSGGNQNQ